MLSVFSHLPSIFEDVQQKEQETLLQKTLPIQTCFFLVMNLGYCNSLPMAGPQGSALDFVAWESTWQTLCLICEFIFQLCAVCLEDFKPRDELGICPCKHAFHRK